MVGTKEGKFLKFTLDDGKTVKYDLSTGESIGVKGNPVKNTSYKFTGLSIEEVIDTLDNENYKKFLKFVHLKEERVSSFGTLLVKAVDYSPYEQLFSSNVKVDKYYLRFPQRVNSNVIRFCKKFDLVLTDNLCEAYNKNSNFCTLLFCVPCITFTKEQKSSFLNSKYIFSDSLNLINGYNYNPKSIIKYIDDIMTYEALGYSDVISNLCDYVRMMSKISNRYDKYPRNLLTSHQIAIRNYNRLKEVYNEEMFKKTVDESFEWKYKDYIVVIPKCTQDIKDEAVQQNNCVASYIDRVIDERCKIVFLRKRENPEKSLVTVELINNKVVQSRRAYNASISSEEFDVLKKYEEYLNKKSEE